MKTTKTFLLAMFLSWVCAAGAITIPIAFAPVTFKITATFPASSSYVSRTNASMSGTNVILKINITAKNTVTNDVIDNTTLLAWLANSFATNFPAGAQLYGNGDGFSVMDATGSNEVLEVRSVFSVVEGGSTDTSVSRFVLAETNGVPTFTSLTSSTHNTLDATITYDDTARATGNGTHTKFSMRGPLVGLHLTTLKQARASVKFEGFGSGTLNNKTMLLHGKMSNALTEKY